MTGTGQDAETASQAVAPYLYLPDEAELRWMGEVGTAFLATGERTGGAFCLVDEHAPKGETVPLHRHAADVESFYVLEGEVAFYLGEQPGKVAGAGSFVHVPAGAVHGFRVLSDRARYLILTTAHHGEFYRAITLPSGPGRQPPQEKLAEGTIGRAAGTFGIEYVGPLPDAT